jgi:hypothetical protein
MLVGRLNSEDAIKEPEHTEFSKEILCARPKRIYNLNLHYPTKSRICPVDRLIPYAKNPRKNDSAVEQMCASIKEFGLRIPCLVRTDGQGVDGHLPK